MAGTAVLLLCVFLGLTDITKAQTIPDEPWSTPDKSWTILDDITIEPSTITTVSTNDNCSLPWNVTVHKNLTVSWDGVDRIATVYVTIKPIEIYGDECLKNTNSPAAFNDKEAPPIPDPPCFNSKYQVVVELRCSDDTEAKKTITEIWTEPDAPLNVHATDVTTSSFRVVWEKPPGTIVKYKVKVDSIETVTTDTYIDLKDLEPITEYKIQVSANNSVEWGKWSEEITIETKKIELPTPRNLREVNVSDTTIGVAWDKVVFENHRIFYSIRYSRGPKVKIGLNTTQIPYILKRLQPYTMYFIQVRARTFGATGNWTETLAVKTLPGVPSEPENVTEVAVDSVSIKIQWKEPSPSTGPIKFYTVEWSQTLGTPEVHQDMTNNTFYTIGNLIPNTSYDIWVSAATEAGVGNSAPVLQVKTAYPIPPENLRKSSKSSSSISLKWDEPHLYKGRGIVDGYSVRWNKLGFSKTITPITTGLSMTIVGLQPKAKYMFEVQLWIQGSTTASDWSQPLLIETDVGVPNPPEKVREGRVSDTSIEVIWNTTASYENLVTVHTVEWSKAHGVDTVTENTTQSSYIIEHLEAFTNYSIRVKSWTVDGAGEWADPITVQTAVGVPLIPRNVKEDGVTNTSIFVKWDEPLPMRGPIELYAIKWQEEAARVFKNYSYAPSYLIDKLTPYQKYSIQVSAKTDAGFGNWSVPITVRTDVGIPFQPRNLKEDKVTNTTILMKWDEPYPVRGPIVIYFIEWQEKGSAKKTQKSSINASYLMGELTPCREYLVRVSARTKAGLGIWSDTVTVSTTTGLPMVPRNVTILSTKRGKIEIGWEEPEPHMGNILSYSIRWGERDSDLPFNDVTNGTSYVIKNLSAYTFYLIQVRASTGAGDGEWSETVEGRTSIGIPSLPRDFREKKSTNTSIEVEWKEPSPTNGPITNYTVKWVNLDDDSMNDSKTGDTTYLIKGLEPYTNYSVQVRAATKAGFGNWTEALVIRTDIGVPFQPRNLKEDKVTNTTILMKWDEPYPVRGPIETYFIEWQKKGSEKRIQKSSISPSYLMGELTPCKEYFIRVSARTKAGLGNWSDPLTVSTTTGLPMVPRNVTIFSSTRDRLAIRWEEPEPHLGNILSYSIRWGERDSDMPFNDVTNGTSYVIKNLSAYTWYSIQVRASTGAGDGEWSKPVEGRTEIGIPSLPRDVHEKKSTNTSIEVEWKEPSPTNGPISNYTVKWVNLDNNLMKNSTARDTTYQIKGLKPYTNYSIQVRASTQAGFSKYTDAIVIRTDIGVPLKPRNIKSVTVTDTSIHLKWEEPEPVVGYITHYDVECINNSSDSIVTGKVENLYYIIKNLSPYTNYTIRIRAATSAGSGQWSDPILVQTLSGVPLPPKNLEKIQVTNLTICIKWEDPSPFKGPILSYNVRWQHADSKKVNTENTAASPYCIQKLEPFTFYHIDVQAKTAAGLGPWSGTQKIQTAVGIPVAIKHVEVHNKTAWSIYLTWSPPDPSNGPLKEYEVKWGEHDDPKAMRNLTKNIFFAAQNLTPYTKYIFEISASTNVGFGPPSVPILVQTDIAVPSAPVNLKLVSASNISLTLKWQQPTAPNGPILGYTVRWNTTYENDSPQFVAVKSPQHEITDLDPYKQYSIHVSANTSAGSGPWSDVLMANTAIGVPKNAQLMSIAVEDSKTISVEWATLNPYPGPTTYVLQVWRKPSHCNPGSQAVLQTSKEGHRGSGEWKFNRPETIEGVTPYSDYYVRIILKTVVGESISANSSVVTTPPDSPGPPRMVESECKESTETVVRWKSPFNPNGKITEYLVRYGVEYSGCSEESVFVEDECQENHSLRLRGLRPERKYKIYVRAKAEDVEEIGDEASIKGYCVLPAGIPPVGEINSLTIRGSGPHTLDLDWHRNVFSDTMGDITHYAVIIGVREAVGNATSGRIAETFPSWANYSGGFTSVYQATPLEWNPFDEEQVDPLKCKEITKEGPGRKTFIRCTIGVDKECSSDQPYCNGPLKPSTRYGVKLQAFTRGGFSETDPLYTITDPIKDPSSIAGIIVGVIVIFLMLGAFIVFTVILKRKGKLIELRLSILAKFGRQPTATQLPAEQVLQLEACPTVVPLTIRNFADHVRLMMSDSHLRFSQEFENLKKTSPKFPCSAAEMDENRPKNRWLNIFPYDHSRVKLLPLGDEPGSDFVNANYVPGCSSLREYIATQGPLAGTVDDFWRMVWEQSVSMIVMLTQCVERGKNKCEQYWPDAGEAKHYGDMQVRTISESMLSCYIIRLFHVQLGSQERRVKQMHFTHWPDFGCPESPDDLINFIRAVRDHLPRFKPGPIIVHCSAGVGRTGTFIAVDRLSQQLRSTDTIDIFGTVMELRHHRINMVQTEDQYIYIHLCVNQLADDVNQPPESEFEEAIYSNLGMEKVTEL